MKSTRKYYTRGPEHIINHRIRVQELRVIAENENLGVMTTQDALREAQKRDLDLVLVSPNAKPPVAKILDYKKFLYAERKKQSAAKTKSKKSELKEFKMRPTTGQGDIDRYSKRAREFITTGNRVKLSVAMRGRENAYPHIAHDRIRAFGETIADIAKMEAAPKRTGGTIWAVFVGK